MWKVFAALIMIAAAGAYADDPGTRDYIRGLTERPADTTLADNIRIWLPVERGQSCRVTIEIADSSGAVIRHLIDRLIPSGYYNFYWDRRNDAGDTVPSGHYTYLVTDCGAPWLRGDLTADYPRGEQLVDFKIPSRQTPDSIWFDIRADSMLVSIEIYDGYDQFIDRPVGDSVYGRGRHGWAWTPTESAVSTETGRYKLYIWFDNFMYATTVWHRR